MDYLKAIPFSLATKDQRFGDICGASAGALQQVGHQPTVRFPEEVFHSLVGRSGLQAAALKPGCNDMHGCIGVASEPFELRFKGSSVPIPGSTLPIHAFFLCRPGIRQAMTAARFSLIPGHDRYLSNHARISQENKQGMWAVPKVSFSVRSKKIPVSHKVETVKAYTVAKATAETLNECCDIGPEPPNQEVRGYGFQRMLFNLCMHY